MDTSQRDEDLIVSFQRGVQTAFDQVFKTYWPKLVYFARQFTTNLEDAEDIVEEIFTKLWNRRSDFEAIINVKAFLYISTKNACLNYVRIQKYQPDQSSEMIDQLAQSEELQFEKVKEIEMYDFLAQEVDKLTGNIKLVMILAFYHGLKNQQIAERLNISVGSVETCKSRGLKKLRDSIQANKSRLGLDNWLLLLILYYMLVCLCKWYFGAL